MLGAAVIAAMPAYAQEKPAAPAISGNDLTAYARARAAEAMGAADTAAAGYAIALGDVPDDPVVALRAYRQGLAAGDLALAKRASAVLVKTGTAPPDTAILDYAVAVKAHDWPGAEAAAARMTKGPLAFMIPVLRAWVAFDQVKDPMAVIDARPKDPLARRYADEHRALLQIAKGQAKEGSQAIDALVAEGVPDGQDLRINGAQLLMGMGARDDARALLPGRSPGSAKPSAAFGASRLFLGLSGDLVQEDAAPLSILLTRAALLLDPSDDRSRLYLAEALSRSGSDRLALDVLAQIKRDSPFVRAASARRAVVLQRAGRMADAVALAKALTQDKEANATDMQAYAELLVLANRFGEGAAAYGRAIDMLGDEAGWSLHFQRGKALDRAGNWAEAQGELRKAVALAPDQVDPLAYLGLGLVEHQGDLVQAQSLLERARRLKPDDPALTDSLGWSHYLRGDTAAALPLLEEAVKADPGGSLANEHLGDAYWTLGRRIEARYAWGAATIYADPEATKRITVKLARGL